MEANLTQSEEEKPIFYLAKTEQQFHVLYSIEQCIIDGFANWQ